ncbi:MAG TPA: gamma-glutamyl-gamma-aminobutyrate hydrolase family protein [Anaerolineaceae bacterium]|nr:gamma-glutamyl-gamma-aminobutyrate hydrolase family protein [Anaerolineaceae bacterium]
MDTPLIGITAYQKLNESGQTIHALSDAYVQAVLRAGGLPVLLPPCIPADRVSALLQGLDAVVFSGGADIDPARFNGTPHPNVYDIDLERDELEICLVQRAAEQNVPFLGICRGIQVVNVALGGTLFTDIADQLPGAHKHDYYPGYGRDHLAHTVQVQPGSRLAALVGENETGVNSLHHQGIERLAADLRATAFAPDGLVEGVELPGHRFGLGVQWHPESIPAAPASQAIFQALVEAARA